jgi:hypothetical protein
MPEDVLGQVPAATLKVDPTVFVSVRTGRTVGAEGGKKPVIEAEVTVAVSPPPTFATITRILKLQTSNVGMYVEVAQPPILIHEMPSADFCHW